MSNLLLNIVPIYVQKTIFSQLRLLFSTPYFSYQDKEDLIQDFLLFYIDKFSNKKESFDEAYVVVSIRNFTRNIIDKAKIRHHYKADLGENFDEMLEQIQDTKQSLADVETNYMVERILKGLSDKERDICIMIMGGASLNEISRIKNISKNTIYKIFNKIAKF